MPTESAASSSSQPDHHHHHPTQPVEDRIVRAIRHRLRLLHRSESDFYVLGATGNVYTVTLSSTPSCTCPDHTVPCKHILFILIRVLGVPLEDGCLRRTTLRPCELRRLLTTPTSPEYLAGAIVREKFHQLFLEAAGRRRPLQQASSSPAVEEGAICPVCLEELGRGGEEKVVVACGTCRNPIHDECLMTWKRSRRRRSTTCVICRARWGNNRGDDDQEERYLNLSAFVSEEDGDTNMAAEAGGSLSCID